MKTVVRIVRRKLKPRGMRAVYSYAVQWVHHGKTRTESYGTNKELAERMKARKEDEIEQGILHDVIPISFEDFTKKHLSSVELSVSTAYYNDQERVLRQFKDCCDPQRMADINTNMIYEFRNYRLKAKGRKVSPATVNKSLRTLQAIFEEAKGLHYLLVNPFDLAKNDRTRKSKVKLGEPEPAKRIATKVQFDKLIEASDDQWKAIFTIAYYAGLRREEILSLKWSDIDFEDKVIQVTNFKAKNSDNLPVDDRVIEALKPLRRYMLKSELIFANQNGEKIANNFDRKRWAIMKKAGLLNDYGKPLFTLHDLRKTCGTDLRRAGVDLQVVSKMLRHSSVAVTAKYYAKVDMSDLTKAVKKRAANTA